MKNKKKKILLLGMYDSTYIVHFIFDVLIPLDFNIYIWSEKSEINNKIEKNENVHVITLDRNIFLFRIFRKIFNNDYLYLLIKIIRLKFIHSINYIHIQFVRSEYIKEALLIANKNSKILCSYWGSDILRAEKEELQQQNNLLKHVSFISGDSKDTEKKFNELFSTYKYNLIYYGDSICDEIKKLQDQQYKKQFNINENLISIAIGYNARIAQQHIRVLDEIEKLSAEIKNRIQFIFQLNYCVDDENYLNTLKKRLLNSDINYVIIDQYMDDNTLAKLRKSVDIFINSQTTDAFCNTIKEYLYLGKIIINPVWLQYKELDDWNLTVITYNDFFELPKIIEDLVKNNQSKLFTKNIEIMADKVCWDSCREYWKNAYNSI